MEINLRPLLTKFYKLKHRIYGIVYSKYRFMPIKEDPLKNYIFMNISFLNLFKIKKKIALAFVDMIVVNPDTEYPYFYGCGDLLYPMGLYEQTRYYSMYNIDKKYLVNIILVPSSMKEDYAKAMEQMKIKLGFDKNYADYSERSPEIIKEFLHETGLDDDRNTD